MHVLRRPSQNVSSCVILVWIGLKPVEDPEEQSVQTYIIRPYTSLYWQIIPADVTLG